MEHASIPKSHGDKMFFSLKMGSLQLARRCWKNSKCCTTCVRCRCRCWCCWHLSCLFLGNFCSQLVLQTTTDGFWVSRSQFNHMDSYVQFWHLQNSILSTKLDFEHNKQMGGLFKRRFCPFFQGTFQRLVWLGLAIIVYVPSGFARYRWCDHEQSPLKILRLGTKTIVVIFW